MLRSVTSQKPSETTKAATLLTYLPQSLQVNVGGGYSFPYISNIVFIGLAATAEKQTLWKQVTGNKTETYNLCR
jgi:hypothetical protein